MQDSINRNKIQNKGTPGMKSTFLPTTAPNGAKRIYLGLALGTAVMLMRQDASAITTVDLGSDSSFAILAGSEITDASLSTIIGNVGLSPATGAAIGLTALQVNGTIYSVDAAGPAGSVNNPALLTQAKNDLTTAYNDAFGRSATASYGAGDNQLGGKTLGSGVYNFGHAATANLIGTLTLDAHGDPNAVWIFQATSDLITAVGSKVVLTDGAQACHVFWEVGSSATLKTDTDFVGTIMSAQSIALQHDVVLDGRALAEVAAVTLDNNSITDSLCTHSTSVPESGSTLLLLGSGLATLFAFRRYFSPA